MNRRQALLYPLFGLSLVLALSTCQISDTAEPEPETQPEPDPEPAAPVELVAGTTIGEEVFPPGNTDQGGQGEPVDGIGCLEPNHQHYHAHLSFFVNGERIAIPAAVGVVNPSFRDNYVNDGDCLYWMHTHDGTGLVHIEPPVAAARDFTVGELFDIWGQPLTSDNVAGYEGELSVFVDGVRYTGDVRSIVFKSHKHICLEIGRPLAPPPLYIFQG